MEAALGPNLIITPQIITAEAGDILISPRLSASDVMGTVTFVRNVMQSFTKTNKRMESSPIL